MPMGHIRTLYRGTKMKYKREDILAGHDEFINWMFIALISQKGLFPQNKEWEGLPEAKEFDINFTIEGVEVDFIKAMERVEAQIDERERNFDAKVSEKALILFEDKMDSVLDEVRESLLKTVKKEL